MRLPRDERRSVGWNFFGFSPVAAEDSSAADPANERGLDRAGCRWNEWLAFRFDYSLTRFSRSALATTDTELKLMAAAAISGESKTPKNG